MGLTLLHGPLAAHPAVGNYRIEGQAHKLFFDDFPRRVHAVFAGKTAFDTRRGKLLHETGLLPQLYVPRDDVRFDMLEQTTHTTYCPFKGDALYWSLAAAGRTAANAAWAYPDPVPTASWLRDYVAFYWDPMDAWFDEDEKVQGHLRDPYHRVDVREATRHVKVMADGRVIAETGHPRVLSETGLPNRFYIPPRDVRRELLELSDTHTICPYKGTASYWTARVGDRVVADAGWFYPEPLTDAANIRDYVSFLADGVTVEVDGAG